MIIIRLFIALIVLVALFGAIGERENENLRAGMVTITCFGLVCLILTLLYR